MPQSHSLPVKGEAGEWVTTTQAVVGKVKLLPWLLVFLPLWNGTWAAEYNNTVRGGQFPLAILVLYVVCAEVFSGGSRILKRGFKCPHMILPLPLVD